MNNYKIYPKQYLSVNMLVDKNKCFVIMPFADELNHVYGTINTEKAGNPDFSGLPAFFVTNLLLVQCSI